MFFFCLKKYIAGVFIKPSLLQTFQIEYYWDLFIPLTLKGIFHLPSYDVSIIQLYHLPLYANIRYKGLEMYFKTSFFVGIYNVVKINPVVCDQWQTPPS